MCTVLVFRGGLQRENPLVIKSLFLFLWFADVDENRLWIDSLPCIFCRLLRSSCSSRTLAVNIAVAAFLMPVDEGVDAVWCEPFSFRAPFVLAVDSFSSFCFRFFDPGTFFRE